MNEQNQFERTDAELEALLRATFGNEARNQVSDREPVPPFPATERLATVHPLRRRWSGVVLVAAALVGIVVGGSILGREAMDAHTPTPPATSGAPEPTVTSAPSVTAGPTGTPTSSATTSASTAPPVTTKQVTVQGVTLTVPTSWQVVAQSSGYEINPGTCLTPDPDRAVSGYAADNCELSLNVGTPAFDRYDVDSPGFAPDGGICGTDGRVPDETVTTTADVVTVDGVTAEHRVFTGFCLDYHIQQWTIPTKPFVQFTRRVGNDDAAALAQAVSVVQSATLPGPRSDLWLSDHGVVTGMSGANLSLDRVTVLAGRGIVNNNPATYDYPIAADARIQYSGAALSTLTVDQLRTLANGGAVAGVPPPDQLSATITTDGEQATRVDLYPQFPQ